jgi:hypothetical protein
MLDYGTIIISGTGGSKEPFHKIAASMTFRRRVQDQISAAFCLDDDAGNASDEIVRPSALPDSGTFDAAFFGIKASPKKLLPLTLFVIAVTSLFSVQPAQAYTVTLEQVGSTLWRTEADLLT